jgi:hypothetical protein
LDALNFNALDADPETVNNFLNGVRERQEEILARKTGK